MDERLESKAKGLQRLSLLGIAVCVVLPLRKEIMGKTQGCKECNTVRWFDPGSLRANLPNSGIHQRCTSLHMLRTLRRPKPIHFAVDGYADPGYRVTCPAVSGLTHPCSSR
jgi:hypothetical protein